MKVLIYKAYERFWHWAQVFIVFLLLITGFEIHGSYEFFGYENAVLYHNIAAISFIILIVFTIFWHFATGEWKQYIPSFKNLKAQANYYIFGIFKNAPHPVRKTQLSKLNPLQRLVYFGLKVVLIPLLVVTGVLYLLYRYNINGVVKSLNIDSLESIALLHTIGAFLIIAFIIVHLYLITTGHTVLSNLKAMITGYENLDEHNLEEELSGIEEEEDTDIESQLKK